MTICLRSAIWTGAGFFPRKARVAPDTGLFFLCNVAQISNLCNVERISNLWNVEQISNLWNVEQISNLWNVEQISNLFMTC